MPALHLDNPRYSAYPAYPRPRDGNNKGPRCTPVLLPLDAARFLVDAALCQGDLQPELSNFEHILTGTLRLPDRSALLSSSSAVEMSLTLLEPRHGTE